MGIFILSEKRLSRRLLSIVAGGLLPFAFAPYSFYFISPISLSILFFLWYKTTSKKESFILGYLFGFALFGIGTNWLHISIHLFGGVNVVVATFFTFLFIAFMSLYPALCGYLFRRFFNPSFPLVLPALWLVTEWTRGWLLTGFPWLNIGTSQTDSLLASLAPIIGDYGISFIVCLIAILLVQIVVKQRKKKIIYAGLILLIFAISFLLGKINWTESDNKKLSVALIQGGIPQEVKWQPDFRLHTYDLYLGLSQSYWSSDLLIWPETAIPAYYHDAHNLIEKISALRKENNTYFMSGIINNDSYSGKHYNSILLIDGKHRFYNKHHLVPFGEYLPLKAIFEPVFRFLNMPISYFSAASSENKLLVTEKAVFGMSICYENAYGKDIRQSLPKADILINVSNDAWFGNSLAPHQHLQIARMRAMENGRYLLRSTNTGISAVIDNKGNIITQSPQFKAHALHATAELFNGETPFSRYGNAFILSISLIILFSSLLCQRIARRN